jgi:hypothetical protein
VSEAIDVRLEEMEAQHLSGGQGQGRDSLADDVLNAFPLLKFDS